MGNANATKAIADSFGKRLITYEAGQLTNHALVPAANRSPEMYQAYRLYLERWRKEIGDLIVFYSSTTPYEPRGAWGIREYSGQPLGQTPKRRAILEFISANRASD